jgi:CheY-like chemotaxis protein
MLVQLRGFETDSAFTGGEALEKVRNQPPDLVFLDLMLPDINGYQVCETLKSGKDTSRIRVIMVTARVAAENRLKSFSAGADDYIAKPYTPDQIFQAMDDAVSWRSTAARDEVEGAIRFDTRAAGESLRRIAHLRSLLRERSALDHDAVLGIGAALQALWAGADAWGREHHADLVATLAYRLLPDRLELTLRDTSGWLASLEPARQDLGPKAVLPARFDEIIPGRSAPSITFIKRWPPRETPPPND